MHCSKEGKKNEPRKAADYNAAFYKVVRTYIECAFLPYVSTASFDGTPKRTLAPGSTPMLFKCDVEIANSRVLTTPELREAWKEIVRNEITAAEDDAAQDKPSTPAPPVSAEEKKLISRVIQLCGRLYVRKGLHKLSYFRRVKQRSEE